MNRHGEFKMPGGKLTVADLSIEAGHLARVQVSGDFFLEPDTALDAINAALTGLPADATAGALAAAVASGLPTGVRMYGVSPQAIATAVRRAIDGGDSP
jgi:lipoate-protein ligase A